MSHRIDSFVDMRWLIERGLHPFLEKAPELEPPPLTEVLDRETDEELFMRLTEEQTPQETGFDLAALFGGRGKTLFMRSGREWDADG